MNGLGLLKGMAVTAQNFFGSYISKERLPTVQYPEEPPTTQHASRNFPILIHDGADPVGTIRCVACRICEKECPPQCIFIIQDKDEKGKAIKRPATFDIDYSVCMGCQICTEMCPFDAIKMDSQFELSTDNRFEGLLIHRDQLLRSAEYWESINPAVAGPVNAKIRAQLEKKKAAAAAKANPAPAKKEAEPAKTETPSQPAPATSAKVVPEQKPAA
jgi:NADH-quinone oxidoreductase subunit I